MEPLEVTFDRPLDHGLVARCLHIEDAAGRVGGSSTVGHEERSWRFAPAAPWLDAPHHLVVDAVLEDVAGNSVSGSSTATSRAPRTHLVTVVRCSSCSTRRDPTWADGLPHCSDPTFCASLGAVNAPSISGFGHIDLTVRDAERDAQWWDQVMGFKVVNVEEREGRKSYAMVHPCGLPVILVQHPDTATGTFDEPRSGSTTSHSASRTVRPFTPGHVISTSSGSRIPASNRNTAGR